MNRSSRTLTRAQLREIEAELRSERARLESSPVAALVGDDAAADLIPRVAVDADSGLAVALESRTRARYDAIVGALARLDAGRYGTCVNCDAPIPYERLIVMPETAHCVSCGVRS